MIVSWVHNRTGPHEVDTETADLGSARGASRYRRSFRLVLPDVEHGHDMGVQAERAARELEAVKAAIKAREPTSLSAKPRKVTTPNIAA